MIEERKISASEGLKLLEALDGGNSFQVPRGASPLANRFFRVRVYTDKAVKVNVNIPMSLLKVASKFVGMGMKFIPEEARLEMEKKGVDLSQINIEELVDMIEKGLVIDGKLIDVDVDDPEEGKVRVEVYVD